MLDQERLGTRDRLGLYVDDVYRMTASGGRTRISTDRAFLLFACEVETHFEQLVLFGRAITSETPADYVLPEGRQQPYDDFCPTPSRGHYLFFVSTRPGACGPRPRRLAILLRGHSETGPPNAFELEYATTIRRGSTTIRFMRRRLICRCQSVSPTACRHEPA